MEQREQQGSGKIEKMIKTSRDDEMEEGQHLKHA